MPPIPVPWKASFLSTLERTSRRGKPRWRNATLDRLYEWDSLHGELEVYSNRGRHLGAVDPETGKVSKLPVKDGGSMSNKRSIVERLLSGEERDLSKIDDEIDAWHEVDTAVPLHEWLGLTPEEYELYVERPAAIRVILAAREQNRSIKELLTGEDAISLFEARGASAAEVTELRKWLKATGRL